jgi:hypothetical protein
MIGLVIFSSLRLFFLVSMLPTQTICVSVYHRRAGPLFAVDLLLKNARHALDLAARSRATMRGVEFAFRDMTLDKEWMGARGDSAGVYGAVCEEAGSRFENDA